MKKILKKFWLIEQQGSELHRDHSMTSPVTPVRPTHDAEKSEQGLQYTGQELQVERHHRNGHSDDNFVAGDNVQDGQRDHGLQHERDRLSDSDDDESSHDQALPKVLVNEGPDAISQPNPQDGAGSGSVLADTVFTRATASVIETADAAGNSGTVYQLQVGQTAQGTLGFVGDRDWFAVDLQAGQAYSFAMTGTGTNNVIDPYLRLMGPNGVTELAADDDSLVGNNSLFTFTATSSGKYYVAAGAFDDLGSGRYGISVTAGTRPSFDIQMGAGVVDGDSAWNSTPGTGATVTYAFRASPATYTAGGSNIATFTQLTATEIAAVRLALKAWSEVSGVTFVEVNPGGYSDNATMLFGNYTDANDGAGAFAYFPGSTAGNAQAGDVWLNTNSIPTNSVLDFGAFPFHAIMHEIGHALGLSHPGLYNAAPGVAITYANNAQFSQDTHQYSIMSYFDESSTGAQFLGYPESPMLFDILAVQNIYGANFSTRAGDTVYGFNSNAGAPYNFSTNVNAAFTIWDGGGIDTLDASGYAIDQIINLNEGGFSTIGSSTYNIAVAVGAVIENAIGGFGVDNITGNAANNSLIGNLGADTIVGGDGNDTLDGGAGADTLFIGRGQDTVSGGLDTDTFRLDLLAAGVLQAATITDLAIGETISWTALQVSFINGVAVSFVGPIVVGNGTATGLNQIDYATVANTTFLYFGLDSNPGADFNLTINGLFSLGQFGIEQNDASGAMIRVQSTTTSYSLAPLSTSVSEGAGTVTFTVTRSGETPAETIFASTTNTEGSTNSGDFTALADQAITFAAGELTKTITVAITNDTVFEASETFGLVVQRNATDADATFLAKSTFTIQDDDPAPVTYSMTPATTSVSEGVGTVTFTVTRSSGTLAETLFASTTTTEGFANSNDFTALADQAIAFAAGELTKTVTVAITNDTVVEGTETFGLVVQRNSTDADTTFLTKSTFTILDNDPSGPDTTAPLLSLTSPADNSTNIGINANIVLTFNEAVKAGTGFIRIVNLSTDTLTVITVTDTSQVTFSGNTMTINPNVNLDANSDYEVRIATAGTIKDIAGNNFATLSNPINFTTGTGLEVTTTYALSPGTVTVGEGAGTVTFTVTRTGQTPAETIFASTTNTEGSTNSGDYTALTDQAITFAAGELTKTVTVAITNDTVFESNETFGLVVQRNTTDADTTFLAKSTFTIQDNDPQPTTYALTPGTTTVNEGAGTVTFTVTRSGGTPAETIFASTTTTEGSANNGDFTAVADQAITFAAGELTKTVTVAITNDTVFEPNEIFGLVVQRNTTDADTTFLAKSTFTIQDNDVQATTYSMTPVTTSVSEGVGTVTFTITRSGGTPAETIFASTTNTEGSTNSGDFTALADQAITFAAGELTKTITVAITNDTVFEASETFGLVVQRNATDADATFLAKSTFTIQDDDPAPVTYSMTPATTSVSEGVGTVTFTVTRSSGTLAETLFASTTTTEGFANSNDFTALADQAIAFAAGELTKTVTVAITNDTVVEGTETFGLVVQRNSTDADTTFLTKSTFTILDNDPSGPDTTAPLLSLTSPADNSTNIGINANIVLTFNEAVKAGTGFIRIVNLSTDILTIIAVTDTSQVTFSGNTMTINPKVDLDANSDYEVLIATAGTIKDIAGNNFASLSNPINFTTGDFLALASSALAAPAAGTGNDTLVGTFENNTMLGGSSVDTFVWKAMNGTGDGIGIDTIDVTAGEWLDFDMTLLSTLKLANGSVLSNGSLVMGGSLHEGAMPSLALNDPSTLAFDWNGDGFADAANPVDSGSSVSSC